ncbi:MAG: hypothetical protein LBH12_04200 [Dysgonamonadaceae bacterium]|jgi:hypothetical protein|nr:hypothetical protein [Dysgonamonadaceae bacterium]
MVLNKLYKNLPLGSDTGIKIMGPVSLWLATFIAFGHYWRILLKKERDKDSFLLSFLILIVFLFLLFSFRRVMFEAYYDEGIRTEKVYSIDNNLATTFTTKVKSEIMNELLNVLDDYVAPGDSMLCFESLAMIHYLTQTIPFTGNSWVWVYDPNNFEKNLLKAESLTDKMPVVLRQKCQPLNGYWTTFAPRYNDTTSEDNYEYKKRRIIVMNDFLNRHNYQIRWENELFQILVSDL